MIDQPVSCPASTIVTCCCGDCRNATATVAQAMVRAMTVRAAKTTIAIGLPPRQLSPCSLTDEGCSGWRRRAVNRFTPPWPASSGPAHSRHGQYSRQPEPRSPDGVPVAPRSIGGMPAQIEMAPRRRRTRRAQRGITAAHGTWAGGLRGRGRSRRDPHHLRAGRRAFGRRRAAPIVSVDH